MLILCVYSLSYEETEGQGCGKGQFTKADDLEIILINLAQDPSERSQVLSPEKHLVLAILTGAIEELSATVLYLRRNAADWMVLDNDFIFGFVPICEMLDISPSALRKHLGPLIERGLHEQKKPERAAAIPHDEKASHEYVSSGHCSECHNRYRNWYKQHGPVKGK